MVRREEHIQEERSYNRNHEEADTRIILHLLHESKFNKHIMVKSVDTAVLILLNHYYHYYHTLPSLRDVALYILLEHKANRRFISIKTVLSKNIDNLVNLARITELPVTEALKIATKYVLLLYKNKDTNIRTLNDLHLKIATKSNKFLQLTIFLPTFFEVCNFLKIRYKKSLL